MTKATELDISKLNIYQKIHGVMSDWTTVFKGEKKVANQYNYVSHDDVTAALHTHMVKWRLILRPTITTMVTNGNRTETCLEVEFINIDNPAEKLTTNSAGYGIDSGDKGPGKAVSYAFKYAILKLFALETTDDPDADQKVKHEPGAAPAKVGTAAVPPGQMPFPSPGGFPPFNGGR